jgi:Protein of unknown function (DUF4239)
LDLWLAALIIVGAAALSAAVMLFVRRRAPAGTYFKDVVPAGAVYTVVGTGYMVIVAFVFFVAFESYGAAKSSAEQEATATLAMFHAARLFGPKTGPALERQVICYAREVIADEWPTMRKGEESPIVEARVNALEEGAGDSSATGSTRAAALDQWFTLNEDRRRGRQGRIAEASPLVPPLIWLIIILGGAVVIFTVCFFADAEEARLPQGSMIAAVAIVVVSGLILVRFLDKPYEDRSGSIKPMAMMRTLNVIDGEHAKARPAVRCS